MEHVHWARRPVLAEPVVIAAFEGWNDAGDAASTAARYLADRWDAELVAELDPEEFTDFSTNRPEVRLDDDGRREVVWPSTEILAASVPGGGDALFVLGHEPHLRWRTFCTEIASASYERQVSELVEADEETITYVASLEERHDAGSTELPSGGSIADEVERFLREHPGS